MSWNAKWSLATNQNRKALLEKRSVANREDLPMRLFGAAATLAVSKPWAKHAAAAPVHQSTVGCSC